MVVLGAPSPSMMERGGIDGRGLLKNDLINVALLCGDFLLLSIRKINNDVVWLLWCVLQIHCS